jgi:lysophospholipase L1-like esterase
MSQLTTLGRRLSRAAVVTAIAGTVGGAAVIAAQAVAARTRPYAKPDMRLAMRSAVGAASRPTLRLVLLGDATALGVGVERVADTVGGQLAALLAEGTTTRRVELSSVAVAGSRSADLATQVARALVGVRPDIAVILVGTNDVTHLARPTEAAGHLGAAVRRLDEAGIAVVVGTCPDFGALRAYAPPLRQLAGLQSRRLARVQAIAARAAGATVVDLGAQTGAVFRADAGTLCHDGFHPSADGYRVWAHALLPALEEAVAATSGK